VNYLKGKCLLAETYDYFGRTQEARLTIESEGKRILDGLQGRLILTGENERRVIREKIRLSLLYSHVMLYREHSYKAFIDSVRRCQDVLSKISDAQMFPCWGMRAQIAYYLARAYRQTNEFDLAEELFSNSIEFTHRRAQRKKSEYERSEHHDVHRKEYEDELAFARYRAGISLGLGLGWVNFTKGLLTSALRHNILPARVLLEHTDDKLNKAPT
jgi:hypothetical protein